MHPAKANTPANGADQSHPESGEIPIHNPSGYARECVQATRRCFTPTPLEVSNFGPLRGYGAGRLAAGGTLPGTRRRKAGRAKPPFGLTQIDGFAERDRKRV